MPETFPTMEQVEKADRVQIARWHCFLPPPKLPVQQEITDRIADRFLNMGGLTPGLRKKIGITGSPDGLRAAPSGVHSAVNLRGTRHSHEQIAAKPDLSGVSAHERTRRFKAS